MWGVLNVSTKYLSTEVQSRNLFTIDSEYNCRTRDIWVPWYRACCGISEVNFPKFRMLFFRIEKLELSAYTVLTGLKVKSWFYCAWVGWPLQNCFILSSSVFSSVNPDHLPALPNSQGCSEDRNDMIPCDQPEWRLRQSSGVEPDQTLMQILLLLLTSCVILNQLLVCSEPH